MASPVPTTFAALIDGFGSDAVACARLLAAEGHTVTMVGPGRAPAEARALLTIGVTLAEHASPTEPPLAGDVLVVDCWTAETAPLVVRHRNAGARIAGIGDLVLERTRARTLGVTGSAGKTTATRLAAAMMAASGIRVGVSSSARAGNAWPSAELVAGLPHPGTDWLALELTSTHLAYMTHSPDVAVITGFWPDHIELHGTLERYRAAKAAILRHQGPTGACIVNVDDPGAATFAQEAVGTVYEASIERSVTQGVGIEGDDVVHRRGTAVTVLCRRDAITLPQPHAAVAVAAACAALVCGADPQAVARHLLNPTNIPHRRREIGTVDGVRVIDDSAATTPRKARSVLAGLDPARVVAIVGGELAIDGVAVHATAAEATSLAEAVAAFRSCRAVVAFGPAAERVPDVARAATLGAAFEWARRAARPGDTIVLSPMFPVPPSARVAFIRMVHSAADIASDEPHTPGDELR